MRAMILALGLMLVASPVSADVVSDTEEMIEWQTRLTEVLATAQTDETAALLAIAGLRSDVAEFTPSEDCVLPTWAMQLVIMDTMESAIGMNALGETDKGIALVNHAVAMMDDFDPMEATLACA